MLTTALRRSGGSLIFTVPQSYIEQNGLVPGSRVSLEINGAALLVRATRPRLKLADFLAATPKGLHRVEGWDDIPMTGFEL